MARGSKEAYNFIIRMVGINVRKTLFGSIARIVPAERLRLSRALPTSCARPHRSPAAPASPSPTLTLTNTLTPTLTTAPRRLPQRLLPPPSQHKSKKIKRMAAISMAAMMKNQVAGMMVVKC